MNHTNDDGRRQDRPCPARIVRAAALALLTCALAAACGGDDDTAPAPMPAPAEATATMGTAGGTLTGPDGVQVVVPPGALTQDTVIRVARTAAGAPALPDEVPATEAVYEFTPHDIDFQVPVTISMPAPASADAQVFMASPGADWRGLDAVDSAGQRQWQVLGFSWSLIASCRPVSNDPFTCVWPRTTADVSAVPPAALTRLNFGNPLPLYRVSQAATVSLRFVFSAARDCGSASVKITRWKRGVNNANGRPLVTTLLETSPVLSPQSTLRAGGEVVVPVAFAEADSGVHYLVSSFSCLRPGRTQRSTYGGTVQIDAEIAAAPVSAPTIGQQPSDQSVAAGAAATFTAVATGAPTPTLQWQRSTDGGTTWADILGATGSAFSISATSSSDNGNRFRMVATNSAGSIATSGALLTVATVPVPPVPSIPLADALDATAGHTCAIKADQTLVCWGMNGSFQVGDGTPINRLVPTPVINLTGVVAVNAGVEHSCARMAGGSVACWGSNFYGQIGNGSTGGAVPVPEELPTLPGALAISAGTKHTCALRADRTVACWGGNDKGQLGNGTTTDTPTPVTVPGLSNVQSIVAGWDRSCAVLVGGGVQCWGWNTSGQLGDGTLVNRLVPTTVVGLSGAVAVAIDGNFHSCALKADGSVMCWGDNSLGALGSGGAPALQPTPVSVVGLANVVALATGSGTSCAVLSETGGMACWGENSRGSVGDGSTIDRPTPVTVPGIRSVAAVKIGSAYTCALKSDGSMSCWGRNITGSLGDGTTVDRTSPVGVVGGAVFWR